MNQILRLLPEGDMIVVEHKSPRESLSLRLEHESVHWMKHLAHKFSRPRALVVEVFGGTFVIAMACLKTFQHRHFV